MDKKLEAVSLMRLLPAGAADLGDGVTREQLREAGLGAWSTRCGRRDDVSAATVDAPDPGLEDYDAVLPQPEDTSEAPTAPGGPVVRMQFSAS